MKYRLNEKGKVLYRRSQARYEELKRQGYTSHSAFDRVAWEQGKVHGEIHIAANSVNPDWVALVSAGLAER